MSTETGRSNALDQAGHGGQEPVDLFALGHLGAGAGLYGADVEDVGALGHDLVGPGQKASQSHVAPLSKNESGVRLRIPMTSARLGDVVAAATEVERGGRGQPVVSMAPATVVRDS